ncbi:hypothetical protein PACILC2_34590 [Paenibacillus cisolokensis]|uniref:KTSC domain-containing protein n=1 Tax=Paenibacillus cisolokensis TaxID=1658519 RepID=A0ABQ4NAE8_9BACL|nr:hypothetical protein PACILC2_34590 [Paenibacillus cisolokensis]
MIRIGRPLAHNTFAVYVNGTQLVEIIYARSRQQAYEWARRTYGDGAYIMMNVQARDITLER